ncbi:cytochrome o ubiquinol oxidase subunit III [Arsenophonus symbiont of Ornithomya chloropus]|uniref:cytochrome o ubiquinol oxidase subunit III n=1 Tax=Arsenophonus symbiont of Ornithomya chloropus TaxID=634121 RepID=UPI0032B16788
MSINLINKKFNINKNHENYNSETKIFGFWIYLMSDLILFACLFATYFVLVNNVAEGPTGKEIFKIDFVLKETLLLLSSSLTYAFTIFSMHKKKINYVKLWLVITFLLGSYFINMELYEFHTLISQGYGPNKSAFLSAFFTLISTHGIHISFGLIWIIIMLIHISYRGLTIINQTRLHCLSLFWHFLDIIWIFIFSFVYLFGVIK